VPLPVVLTVCFSPDRDRAAPKRSGGSIPQQGVPFSVILSGSEGSGLAFEVRPDRMFQNFGIQTQKNRGPETHPRSFGHTPDLRMTTLCRPETLFFVVLSTAIAIAQHPSEAEGASPEGKDLDFDSGVPQVRDPSHSLRMATPLTPPPFEYTIIYI